MCVYYWNFVHIFTVNKLKINTMENTNRINETIISFFPINDQFTLCSQKAKEAIKKGNLQEAVNWFIQGLNIARENKNNLKEKEFKNNILNLI